MALMVHPQDHDLVIGTHGRAAYILDDIRPLRSVTKEVLQKQLHMFDIPATYQHQVKQMDGYHFPGDAMFRGDNRPYGALITYIVNPSKEEADTTKVDSAEEGTKEEQAESGQQDRKEDKKKKAKIEVLDAAGNVIRKFDGPMEKGINRASWNLRRDAFKQPRFAPPRDEDFTPQGPEVLPGKYTVRIKLGKLEVTQMVDVLPDPRASIPLEVRRQKYETIVKVGERIEVVAEAVDRIQKTRKAIDFVLAQVKDRKDDTAKVLKKVSEDLKKKLTAVVDKFADEPDRVQGITRRPNTASARLGYVLRSLSSSWDAVTLTQETYRRQAEAILESALKEFNKLFAEDVAAYRSKVEAANLSMFPETEALDVNWKPKKKD
jgi:hypothetical protein